MMFAVQEKNEAAVALGRLGGLARASKLSKRSIREIAVKASAAAAIKRTAAAKARREAIGGEPKRHDRDTDKVEVVMPCCGRSKRLPSFTEEGWRLKSVCKCGVRCAVTRPGGGQFLFHARRESKGE